MALLLNMISCNIKSCQCDTILMILSKKNVRGITIMIVTIVLVIF